MPIRLPNWTRDPFAHLSRAEKKRIRHLEKESDDSLREAHPNGPFALKVPLKLPGRMREPESMTTRRKNRTYMDPKPTMDQPRIYRGRGRSLRLERERKGRMILYRNNYFKFLINFPIL